jgi:zinc-binding in reverse transcriptase
VKRKKIRGILDSSQKTKPISKFISVQTFFRLTRTEVEDSSLNNIFGAWNLPFLPNKIKEFIFRFYNNQLPVNVRLSHYVDNINRTCTFCRILGTGDFEENFEHLFFSCTTTARIHNWFIRKYLTDNLNENDRRKFFFTGIVNSVPVYNMYGTVVALTVQYLIWEMRVQKRVVQPLTLDNDFRYLMRGYFLNSGKLLTEKLKARGVFKIEPAWG